MILHRKFKVYKKDKILSQPIIPPMMHFAPSLQKTKSRYHKMNEALADESIVTQHIFEDFFFETTLARTLFAYGRTAQKDAAMAISKWATTHLFVMPFYQTPVRNLLKGLPLNERMSAILEGLYNTLIMSCFDVPDGAEDKIIRALLNNRAPFENSDGECTAIVAFDDRAEQFHVEGGPDTALDMHEFIFAQSAALYAGDHEGHIYFLNGRRLAPQRHVLATAIERIILAISLTSSMREGFEKMETNFVDIAPFIVAAIKDCHRRDPLRFANAQNMKLSYQESMSDIIEPAIAAMEQA